MKAQRATLEHQREAKQLAERRSRILEWAKKASEAIKALRDQIKIEKVSIRETMHQECQQMIGEFAPQTEVLKMRYKKLLEDQASLKHEILLLDHERS